VIDIRAVEPADLEALYAISLATGLAGGDAAHLYDDPRLVGHIYAAPYACLAPELALVVEDEQGVGGFVVGAIESKAWAARLERDWWPPLRALYPDPSGSAEAWSPDQRRCAMIHHPDRPPAAVTAHYPSHLHMNLLPRLQARGVGSRLFAIWLAVATRQGVQGLHVGVNRANTRAVEFWGRQGFAELTLPGVTAERTIWMGRIEAPTSLT